jgi:hypothetical protein
MSQKKGLMSDKSFNIFITSACIALAALTLVLAWQNRKLKDEISRLQAPKIPPEAMKAGDKLERLSFLDEAGNPVTIDFGASESKTLLLIFSPKCPACAKTIPIWSELLQEPPATTRVIGLRMGEKPAEEGAVLPFPVYAADESGSGLAGKIPFVPTTLLLDEEGTAEQLWYGVLDEAAQKELLGLIGL